MSDAQMMVIFLILGYIGGLIHGGIMMLRVAKKVLKEEMEPEVKEMSKSLSPVDNDLLTAVRNEDWESIRKAYYNHPTK
jgi:hypothetical protein